MASVKALLVVAAVYGVLVVFLRSRRPVPSRHGPGGPARRSVEERVRVVVDRVNLVIIVALAATAIYLVVTRVLWDL